MSFCLRGKEVAEDVDEYLAEGIFWVPEAARWKTLAANAKDPGIGVKVDNAMRAIEADNGQLKGALPKVFGREALDPAIVTGLIDLFSNIEFDGTPKDFDLIGRIYEYFISEFASNEGKRGGDFHTPKPVVELIVQMIEPVKGRLYEPCHGSGSFMVQSEHFLEAHKYRRADLAIYGQERNHTTYGLARMNLAIRGIVARLEWNAEGTLLRDAFPDEKFDYVMANPPFNVSDWSGDILAEDRRWKFGTPPVGNANFAWMQHIYDKLGSTGRGGRRDGQRLHVVNVVRRGRHPACHGRGRGGGRHDRPAGAALLRHADPGLRLDPGEGQVQRRGQGRQATRPAGRGAVSRRPQDGCAGAGIAQAEGAVVGGDHPHRHRLPRLARRAGCGRLCRRARLLQGGLYGRDREA